MTNKYEQLAKDFLSERFKSTQASEWSIISSYTNYAPGKPDEHFDVYKHDNAGVVILLVDSDFMSIVDIKSYAAYLKSIEVKKSQQPTKMTVSGESSSTITSADCKLVLCEAYTETKTSQWKRIRKYKSSNNEILRDFTTTLTNGDILNVTVVENIQNKQLSILNNDTATDESNNKIRFNRPEYKSFIMNNKDYVISFWTDSLNNPSNGSLILNLTYVDYWKQHGAMDDNLSYNLYEMFPLDMDVMDIDDNTIQISYENNEEEVYQQLLELGFQVDFAFLAFVDELTNSPSNKNFIDFLHKNNIK